MKIKLNDIIELSKNSTKPLFLYMNEKAINLTKDTDYKLIDISILDEHKISLILGNPNTIFIKNLSLCEDKIISYIIKNIDYLNNCIFLEEYGSTLEKTIINNFYNMKNTQIDFFSKSSIKNNV